MSWLEDEAQAATVLTPASGGAAPTTLDLSKSARWSRGGLYLHISVSAVVMQTTTVMVREQKADPAGMAGEVMKNDTVDGMN